MSVFAIALLGAAVTLVPTNSDQPREAEVHYGDLNLTTAAGRKTLDRRLSQAINAVCDKPWGQSAGEQARIRKCQKRALAQIVPQREVAIANQGVKLAQD